jgi:hypothetical protein
MKTRPQLGLEKEFIAKIAILKKENNKPGAIKLVEPWGEGGAAWLEDYWAAPPKLDEANLEARAEEIAGALNKPAVEPAQKVEAPKAAAQALLPRRKIVAEPAQASPAKKAEPEPAKIETAKAVVVSKSEGPQPVEFEHSKMPSGIPACLKNAIVGVEKLGIHCKYDVFHDRIVVDGHAYGWRGNVLNNMENVALKVRQTVLQRFKFDPGPTYTFDALKINCLDHAFDPVLDYLDGLRWDGVRRLDNWLIKYCGARPTDLNKAIGRKMLVAAVRRVRSPGCKFDFIIVFESKKQGIGKSTMLRILAGDENFSDAEIVGADKRDQQESVQGVWIYEIGELEGMNRSDVRKVKLFASKMIDAARPAYGRSRVDRPRRCIFVATTNEQTYLRDTTGNRRFWPVELFGVIVTQSGLMMIDLEGIKRDRDQLWAEAAMVEAAGEELVIPQELWPAIEVEQLARMDFDPWLDLLDTELTILVGKGEALEGNFGEAFDDKGEPEWRVASDYLLTSILEIPKEHQNNNQTKRLASVMETLGWHLNKTPIRIGKFVTRGYKKPKG